MQGLANRSHVAPGKQVLINGAGGGAGSFAVQWAKSLGAEVTGVDSAEKLAMIRSLGAHHVVDYQQQDFTKNGHRYDLILDLVASHSIFDYRRSLNGDGIYLMVGGTVPHLLQTLFMGSLLSLFSKKKMRVLAHKPNKEAQEILDLVESGKMVAVIDQCFPLQQTAEAFSYFGDGHAKGKVVITIDD